MAQGAWGEMLDRKPREERRALVFRRGDGAIRLQGAGVRGRTPEFVAIDRVACAFELCLDQVCQTR